jgi:hypothetical protein
MSAMEANKTGGGAALWLGSARIVQPHASSALDTSTTTMNDYFQELIDGKIVRASLFVAEDAR